MKHKVIIVVSLLLVGSMLIAAGVGLTEIDEMLESSEGIKLYNVNTIVPTIVTQPVGEKERILQYFRQNYYLNELYGFDVDGNQIPCSEATVFYACERLLNDTSDAYDDKYCYQIAPGIYSPYTIEQLEKYQYIYDKLSRCVFEGTVDDRVVSIPLKMIDRMAIKALNDISEAQAYEYQYEFKVKGYGFYVPYSPEERASLELLALSSDTAICSYCGNCYHLYYGCGKCAVYDNVKALYDENIMYVQACYSVGGELESCTLATYLDKAKKMLSDVSAEMQGGYKYAVEGLDGALVYTSILPDRYNAFKKLVEALDGSVSGTIDTTPGQLWLFSAEKVATAALNDLSLTETNEYKYYVKHDGYGFYSRYDVVSRLVLLECLNVTRE